MLQKLLLTAQREMSVELVVQMDNGEVEVFNAYRVQHNNSRGPYKGGLRYHPQVRGATNHLAACIPPPSPPPPTLHAPPACIGYLHPFPPVWGAPVSPTGNGLGCSGEL